MMDRTQQVLIRLIACMACVNVASMTGAAVFWVLAGVNGLLAAAWMLMPESRADKRIES